MWKRTPLWRIDFDGPNAEFTRCNEYFVRSLAAVSKNDRFESKLKLALIESVFDAFIFSGLHLQFTVSNGETEDSIFYVQYSIFGSCYLLKYPL